MITNTAIDHDEYIVACEIEEGRKYQFYAKFYYDGDLKLVDRVMDATTFPTKEAAQKLASACTAYTGGEREYKVYSVTIIGTG